MGEKDVFRKMLLIRRLEEKLEALFRQGMLRGTVHCCIGEEVVPVALSELIDIDRDYLCGGHRAHGLSLMMTGKPELLLGEIMGKSFGMAKGLGGSQHVYYKNYFTNGVTGGMAPVTVGIAFVLKQQRTDAIAVNVLGDGAMNEGYVMEAFNLASAMKLPVLFILENNGFAMSTPTESVNSAAIFEARVRGFGLPYQRVEGSTFDATFETLQDAVLKVRKDRSPLFVEVLTHRFCGHSKGDRRAYVPKERDDYWHEHDCLKWAAAQLSESEVAEIERSVAAEVEAAYQYCLTH